jgi:hypothetical protein
MEWLVFSVHHSIDCNIGFQMKRANECFHGGACGDPHGYEHYELDKGNEIMKNLATYPYVRVRVETKMLATDTKLP